MDKHMRRKKGARLKAGRGGQRGKDTQGEKREERQTERQRQRQNKKGEEGEGRGEGRDALLKVPVAAALSRNRDDPLVESDLGIRSLAQQTLAQGSVEGMSESSC
eukprot:5688769-Pyramimonas_sp.AAC.1